MYKLCILLVLIAHVYHNARVQKTWIKHCLFWKLLIVPTDVGLLSHCFHFLVYHVKMLTNSTPTELIHLNISGGIVTKEQAHVVLLPAEGRKTLSTLTLGPISPMLNGYSGTFPKRKQMEAVATFLPSLWRDANMFWYTFVVPQSAIRSETREKL